jgi:hypothetical protein
MASMRTWSGYFNTAQGWSRDVTENIANELRETCLERGEMPDPIEDFIREHASHGAEGPLRFQL